MKFFKKFKLENLKRSLKQIWQRMPLSVLLVLITTGLSLYRIYADHISNDIENTLNKITLTLIITFFLSIGIYLFYEANNYSKKIKLFSQIDSIIFAGIFYYFFEENLFDNSETFVYIMITLAGVLSFVYIAPFIQSWLKKEHIQQDFINHASLVTWKMVLAVITGVIIMLLGFAALASTFALFEIGDFFDQGKMFGTWAILSLSLVAPLFFLINLPRVKETENYDKNKFHFFVVNYLGLSAITIYFIILYAYTVKVLLNFSDWPQGKISWLVIGFSIFGYLVYFTIRNFIAEFKAARIFQKIFPILVLPQVAMLFYAIFLRINQHDWTINRYLVVIFGIWLTLISLYYIFSRKKYLSFMPASLTIFILIISLGPWSVYLYPERRQENKLENNLQVAQILQGNEIIPLENYDDIDAKLSGEIYGSIEYLCDFHGCHTLDFIFEEEINEIKRVDREEFEKQKKNNEFMKDREYSEMNSWSIISKLTEKIKVKRYFKNTDEYIPKFISFNLENETERNKGIDISGYDTLIYLDDYQQNNLLEKYGLEINYEEIKEKLLRKYQDGELISDDQWNQYNFKVTPEDLSFKFETEKYEVLVQLNHLEIQNPDWQEELKNEDRKINNGMLPMELRLGGYQDGYILLKEK